MREKPLTEAPWAATPDKIAEAVRRIVECAHPAKVIVFGSQGRGEPNTQSDVDILVVEHEVQDRYQELLRLNGALRGLLLEVDVLVISQADFEEWSAVPGSVYRAARREGRIVYEAA